VIVTHFFSKLKSWKVELLLVHKLSSSSVISSTVIVIIIILKP